MTLVAGLRCKGNGVLLLADREVSDGISRSEADKIHSIALKQATVFVAIAGYTNVVQSLLSELTDSLGLIDGEADLAETHEQCCQRCLNYVQKRYIKKNSHLWPQVVIVVAFHQPADVPPIMYRNQESLLIRENYAALGGSGAVLAKYFVTKLYSYGMDKVALALLAGFMLREVGTLSAGASYGGNIVLIHEEERAIRSIDPTDLNKLQSVIPHLKESIHSSWSERNSMPRVIHDLLVNRPPV